MEINRITDVAVKAASVRPGVEVVERLYGLLEIHSSSQGETISAGRGILARIGLGKNECLKPRII